MLYFRQERRSCVYIYKDLISNEEMLIRFMLHESLLQEATIHVGKQLMVSHRKSKINIRYFSAPEDSLTVHISFVHSSVIL